MRSLVWGSSFVRASKRLIRKRPDLKEDLEQTLRLLGEAPFSPVLETHKLKGRLAGSWSCSFRYGYRIVFDFVESEAGGEEDILLMDIGTHDEVY